MIHLCNNCLKNNEHRNNCPDKDTPFGGHCSSCDYYEPIDREPKREQERIYIGLDCDRCGKKTSKVRQMNGYDICCDCLREIYYE